MIEDGDVFKGGGEGGFGGGGGGGEGDGGSIGGVEAGRQRPA